MHDVDQGSDVVDWGLGHDTVAQVEDMSRAATGLGEDPPGLKFDLRHRCQEHHRVEIPLYGNTGAESFPGSIEIDAPIESDDRAAGIALELQERGRAGTEMDAGD
jgi:hypothetical protein